MLRAYFRQTAFVLLILFSPPVHAIQLGTLRISIFETQLPQQERMGLVELSALLDITDTLYSGLSVFGAVTGKRGGFFTGGYSGGVHWPLTKNLMFDTGLFIGGGGGGSAPQGGGLMLRGHAGVDVEVGHLHYGLHWSDVRFPNGDIASQQWMLSLSRPVDFNIASGWQPKSVDNVRLSTDTKERGLVMRQLNYFPQNRSIASPSLPAMRLIGFGLEFEQLSTPLTTHYLSLQTAGAYGGDNDGYAEVFWDYAVEYGLKPRINTRASLAVGAGGGGAVATGGGLMARAMLTVPINFTPALSVVPGIGYTRAFDGDFKANVLSLDLAYRYGVPGMQSIQLLSGYRPIHWRVSAELQHYVKAQRKQTGIGQPAIDLIGNRFDLMLTPHSYISGTAYAAVDGDAGGYASGSFGYGVETTVTKVMNAHLELLVGASGGGGIDIGGGLFKQIQTGVELFIDQQHEYSIIALVGKIAAIDGKLDTPVYTLGFAWHISTPSVTLQ